MHGSGEDDSQFVIPCRDTPEILQPAKGIFDLVPFAVLLPVKAKLLLPVPSVRNDGFGSLILQPPPQFSAVVTLVGEQNFRGFRFLDQFRPDRTVMRLATRQHESQKSTLGIRDRVDFGISAAT